jgi:hypothetical protein
MRSRPVDPRERSMGDTAGSAAQTSRRVRPSGSERGVGLDSAESASAIAPLPLRPSTAGHRRSRYVGAIVLRDGNTATPVITKSDRLLARFRARTADYALMVDGKLATAGQHRIGSYGSPCVTASSAQSSPAPAAHPWGKPARTGNPSTASASGRRREYVRPAGDGGWQESAALPGTRQRDLDSVHGRAGSHVARGPRVEGVDIRVPGLELGPAALG